MRNFIVLTQLDQTHKANQTEGNHHSQSHSEIDQNQLLLVRVPNLGSDDVIIPGTANLSFNIKLDPTNEKNKTLVSSIGRVIIKKLAVKFEGNEIWSADNFDVFACY